MIVKRNFSPAKVLSYVWQPLIYAASVSAAVVIVRRATETTALAVPFAPVGTLGAAVAIFVAFRNNASYARWWEARTIWGNVHSNTRILARQLVACTENAVATGAGPDAAAAYRRELVLRTVAVVHALRIELRGTDDWDALRPFLSPDEHTLLMLGHNRSNLLLQRQGIRIKDGVRAGMVGQFDPITLEPNLAALNAAIAACERIKHTPTPRQYDYFTRIAIGTFSTLLPFGLESIIGPGSEWWVVVLSVLIAGIFIILERVGAVIDEPFANRTTDIPLSAIVTAIERDLREQIGDTALPEPVRIVNGYLW